MANPQGADAISIESGGEIDSTILSDELDHVPLKQRQKTLLAEKMHSCSGDQKFKSHDGSEILTLYDHYIGKIEDEKCDSKPLESEIPATARVKVEDFDNSSSLADGTTVFSGGVVPVVKSKNEFLSDFNEDLDHIVLKERKRLLLLRIASGSVEESLELPGGSTNCCEGNGQGKSYFTDGDSLFSGDQFHDNLEGYTSASWNQDFFNSTESVDAVKLQIDSCDGQNHVPANANVVNNLTLSAVKVKDEPYDNIGCHNFDSDAVGKFSISTMQVKIEFTGSGEPHRNDEEMSLKDRMKLMTSRRDSTSVSMSHGYLKKFLPSGPIISESTRPMNAIRPRKRRKTITDSVETALEEDAPGLLQVLLDKGVLVDEIKLYGEMESDEAMDELPDEDSFAELEDVISKLFSQRQSFIKFSPLKCMKAERASYYLDCLVSLVEQARYLQFRKWPVEWGWCRDLQSFIFVFERHNRIVLERPEYGYATYFFELVDSLPIHWQIKRLVTAMKLTSCSRISLLENKPLSVGVDLTEGEAKVLMEYGWVPNSGLGTMLNYRDRVVHDRKTNEESSEWKSKIGKLLVDGFNGGTLVATNIPKKVTEYIDGQLTQVKQEL